ncbi:MAG: hypothetical protein ABIA93_06680 [Candidatus Woesearchaeota archaeon]
MQVAETDVTPAPHVHLSVFDYRALVQRINGVMLPDNPLRGRRELELGTEQPRRIYARLRNAWSHLDLLEDIHRIRASRIPLLLGVDDTLKGIMFGDDSLRVGTIYVASGYLVGRQDSEETFTESITLEIIEPLNTSFGLITPGRREAYAMGDVVLHEQPRHPVAPIPIDFFQRSRS